MVPFPRVRVLVDYRPALRARTGIGEYVHQLAAALASRASDAPAVTVFAASWRDRLSAEARASLGGTRIVERAIPVGALRWSWHHLGWPPVEWLAGPHDVVHSPTPLLLPASRAAQVVTLFDLHFLTAPADATDVAQQDFARHVRDHVRRADHVVAGSAHAAALATSDLGVPRERVTVTPLGAPAWAGDVARQRGGRPGRILLFVGTLEPRKNLVRLCEAYTQLRARRNDLPKLVIVGAVGWGADPILKAIAALGDAVVRPGYLSRADAILLLRGARACVYPSLYEGFGLPVLEAMAARTPVITSNVSALPEVAGDAALYVDPHNTESIAHAIEHVLDDPNAAATRVTIGRARAESFSWQTTAAKLADLYRDLAN